MALITATHVFLGPNTGRSIKRCKQLMGGGGGSSWITLLSSKPLSRIPQVHGCTEQPVLLRKPCLRA